MTALTGPLHLVALVLAVSGAQKLIRPAAAGEALANAGAPGTLAGPVTGRLLGSAELAVGVAAIALPGRPTAAAVAATYAALAGFVTILRRRAPDADCGCFGVESTPPSTAHVAVDLAAAAVGAAATLAPVSDAAAAFDSPQVAVPYLLLVLIGTVLVLRAPALWSRIADRTGALRVSPP